MGDIAQRGNRLTFAKGGVVKRPKKPSTHAKAIPTMAAEGGRIGLKKGSVHKPGSYSYFLHQINKPRKGKAIGGLLTKAGKTVAKKFKKKKVYPETEDLTHQVGPYVGDVGSEGKKGGYKLLKGRRFGPRARKGQSPGRPKKPGPQAPSRPKKPWPPKHSDLLQRYPKMPQPHKSPGDKPYIPNPRRKPGEKKEYQPAAEGGRIGLKKGGSDRKWMQKVSASIKKRGTKGKCTPITKPGCTGRAKALAKTFKKIAAQRKA